MTFFDQIWDWIHGNLSADEEADFLAALEHDSALQQEVDTQLLLLAEAVPVTKPKSDGILSFATSLNRFIRFAEAIANVADVTVEKAKEWLAIIDNDDTFIGTPVPSTTIFHIEGGPSVQDAIVGFVKIRAGEGFPEHTHLGAEKMLVIQGLLQDDEGREFGPGEICENGAGTTHEFGAAPGVDLIYLNITHTGLEVMGMTVGPDDPNF